MNRLQNYYSIDDLQSSDNLNNMQMPDKEQSTDNFHTLNNNLQLFSKSAIKAIDDGYVLTGIGVQAIFTDTIIFNIGNRSVEMNLDDSNPLVPQYYTTLDGNLDLNIPGTEYIVYQNIYDGIDLVFSINNGILKSNYIIRSIDTLKSLKISYSSDNIIEPRSIDNEALKVGNLWKEQDLILKTTTGKIIPSAVNFKISNNHYSFTTGYDKTPFIIDPDYSYLNFGTYLGGSDLDKGYGIAIDSDNNVYVTGYTWSSDFPTMNAYDSTYNGGDCDAFVTSFTSTGSLRWSTYLGGSDGDYGRGIAIGSDNNVYVTGYTDSSDFPTMNAYDSTLNVSSNAYVGDAFITSFNSTGSLRWSTYIGGSSWDEGYAITIDSDNNVYVHGYTDSSNFPTMNAYDSTKNGSNDAFVASILDPLLDKDGDGMPNFYEYQNGLLAGTDDANGDKDDDGLTNIEEYNLGTMVNNPDTDDDGIPDGYEVNNSLDPLNQDTDGDGIPDGYEVNNSLDPLNPDTDGDGDKDGYEIEHHFDPLNPFSNSKTRPLIITIIITMTIIIIITHKIRAIKQAKKLGFRDVKTYNYAKKLGFMSKSEWDQAKKLGFTNKSEWDEAKKLGFENKTEWEEANNDAKKLGFANKSEWDEAKKLGFISKSDIEQSIVNTSNEIDNINSEITSLHERISDIDNKIKKYNPEFPERPSDEIVKEKLRDLWDIVNELNKSITGIELPDNRACNYSDELREKYTQLEGNIKKLKTHFTELQQIMSAKEKELLSKALEMRRSYKLNRIIKRVKSMSLEDFAREMEFNDQVLLKQWLLYEMSDNIPLKLDGDEIIIDTEDSTNIEDAIDEVMVQFQQMEEGKIGKIE